MLSESSYSEKDETAQFWFNMKTLRVEVGPQSSAKNRIGPFANRHDAESALAKVRERSRAWSDDESALD